MDNVRQMTTDYKSSTQNNTGRENTKTQTSHKNISSQQPEYHYNKNFRITRAQLLQRLERNQHNSLAQEADYKRTAHCHQVLLERRNR